MNTDDIITQLVNAGSRTLGMVIGKCKDNVELGYQPYSRLFDTCVAPVLDYASGAWSAGAKNTGELDKVQLRASRYFCGLPRNTTILGVVGLIGWTSGLVRRDMECLRLYNQLITMSHERLTRRIFDYDKAMNGEWSTNLKQICEHSNSLSCWNACMQVDLAQAQRMFKEQYETVWNGSLSQKPKLALFSQVIDHFGGAMHVKAQLNKHKRCLMSQLLCGSLSLEVETGRYSRVSREERLCKLCQKGVEDELHFLFECEALYENRLNLYHKCPELLHCDTLVNRMKMLLNMPYTMSSFVHEIWQRRSQLMSKY